MFLGHQVRPHTDLSFQHLVKAVQNNSDLASYEPTGKLMYFRKTEILNEH